MEKKISKRLALIIIETIAIEAGKGTLDNDLIKSTLLECKEALEQD